MQVRALTLRKCACSVVPAGAGECASVGLSGVLVRAIIEFENGGNSISLKRLLPVLAALGLRLSIAVARNG
jgi:hypothetical protein